jgi:hypothetical protein
MKSFAALILVCLSASVLAHPIPKFGFPSKAAAMLKQAAAELELYKASLANSGKYSCCIKPPKGSKVGGCNMCAAKNGSCACGANLAAGKGVCGECKGAWENGHGAFKMDPKTVAVKDHSHQAMEGVTQDSNDSHLAKYKSLIVQSKKVMVGEKRFNCCVGEGGCDECAMEQYCGCAINLNEDLKKKPGEKMDGICGQCLDGQHAGHGRIPNADLNQMHVMSDSMEMMPGAFTKTMSQEGSGTAWLPASSPMYMKELGDFNGWKLNFMGLGTVNWADAGGKRGESQFFSNSMGMVMAQKGPLQLRVMGSLDPLFNGKEGYPNLFQTGETANGMPLKDRQHPHDGIMELSATYSVDLGQENRAFLYAAPVGEPALGTAAFQHRPSAWENPEAPINHHWNDGTHISSGVVTAGVNLADKWKIEASAFTGREPDENRWDIDPIRLDSASGRLTFNPNKDWSLSASYGFIKEPESLEPGIDQHRIVLSAFNQHGDLSLGAIWARNIKLGENSDALSLEASYAKPWGTVFGRAEWVDKDELVDVPTGSYRVGKFTLGGIKNLNSRNGWEFGLGAYVGLYSIPSSLNSFYGRSPVTAGVFLRIRPGKM